MSLPFVDFTSTWIPLSLLAVLVAYMIHLFRKERRESIALEQVEAAAASAAAAAASAAASAATVAAEVAEMVHASPAAEPATPAAPAAPTPSMAAEEPRKTKEEAVKAKPSLVWRTAWIWLPFVAGFAGQAYLDVLKPLLEKTAS